MNSKTIPLSTHPRQLPASSLKRPPQEERQQSLAKENRSGARQVLHRIKLHQEHKYYTLWNLLRKVGNQGNVEEVQRLVQVGEEEAEEGAEEAKRRLAVAVRGSKCCSSRRKRERTKKSGCKCYKQERES